MAGIKPLHGGLCLKLIDLKIMHNKGTDGSNVSKRDTVLAQPDRLAFKVAEAAEMLGVSTVTVRRLIQRGLIKPVRVLRHTLVPAEELRKLVKP